jgi:CubicO group peptidase (beta-lactamase class C family)
MRRAHAFGRVSALALVIVLAGCTSNPGISNPGDAETAASGEPSVSTVASPTPTEVAPAFPIEAFADIGEDPVSDERAAEFQAILDDMADSDEAGMSATVITADGTWSGATGSADGVRDVRVDSQFGIASITKSVIAAQVMQMVEAGELSLDAPATDYLPAHFDFDTNGATIRQLLDMYSGIPDWYGWNMERVMSMQRRRDWKLAEVLALVDSHRDPVDEEFVYADTNYNLLGVVIEHVRGRPLVDVLRDGVLRVDGTERMIYQPDEAPTPPMAMPDGESRAALAKGGGYLPSLSDASSAGAAGAIASDSPSLAHWWRAFCAGELVSEASLTEMSTFVGGSDGYGLGLFNPTDTYAASVGHVGANFGYVSWAGCLLDEGVVVVVLSNREFEDIGGMARPLFDAVIAD